MGVRRGRGRMDGVRGGILRYSRMLIWGRSRMIMEGKIRMGWDGLLWLLILLDQRGMDKISQILFKGIGGLFHVLIPVLITNYFPQKCANIPCALVFVFRVF